MSGEDQWAASVAPHVEQLLVGYEAPRHAPPAAQQGDPDALAHLVRHVLPTEFQRVRIDVLPVAHAEGGIELKTGVGNPERVDFERLRAFVNGRLREALRVSATRT